MNRRTGQTRSSGLTAIARWGVLVTAIYLCAGCEDPTSLPLPRWTLVRDSAPPLQLELPTKVDDLLGKRGERYVIETRVDLPAHMRGVPITLAFTRLAALVSLRANGQPVESVLDDAFAKYRRPSAQQWRIPASLTVGRELTLRLVVSDRWFQSTWLACTPSLAPHKDGDRWYRFATLFNTASDAIALSFALLLGISYAVIFLGDRRRTAYGFFAAQALCAVSYPLMMLGVTQVVVGRADLFGMWFMALAGVTSIHYTYAHVGLATPSRHWAGMVIVCAVLFITHGSPFRAQFVAIPAAVITIASCCGYQIYLFARLLRAEKHHVDARTLLTSWILITLLAGPDFIYWLGFGEWLEGLHGGSVGILVFATLQTVALSREHKQTMAGLDTLNVELADRVIRLEARDEENNRLADELRRQVAARSMQLSQALSWLGQTPRDVAELSANDVIDGRYRVIARLGEGGMAVVYEVERCEDGRRLALKALRSVSDAPTLARFAREAHIAAGVSHPNLVAIHDIDFADTGFMYVVMDVVNGLSLRAHSQRYGDVPWALAILEQAARGLLALHDHGVVHRDFKPENILLEDDAGEYRVKITDFGISAPATPYLDGGSIPPRPSAQDATQQLQPTHAKAVLDDVTQALQAEVPERSPPAHPLDLTTRVTIEPPASNGMTPHVLEQPQLTSAGQLLGTPAYMAPELGNKQSSKDPTRDVFSFGIVAFELLTGSRCYLTPPIFAELQHASTPERTRLGVVDDTFDAELRSLIERAVSPEAAPRPSMQQLLSAIVRARQAQVEHVGQS